jgi:hypothetical protein
MRAIWWAVGRRALWPAALNVLGNTLLGLAFALLGIYLARWIG